MVTGWGKVGETSPISDVLQKLRVPIVGRRECENIYRNVKGMNITLDMMCAGDVGKDSCTGDSGGMHFAFT
jgi:trypsin